MVNVDFVRLFRRDHEKLFELILMDEVRFTLHETYLEIYLPQIVMSCL